MQSPRRGRRLRVAKPATPPTRATADTAATPAHPWTPGNTQRLPCPPVTSRTFLVPASPSSPSIAGSQAARGRPDRPASWISRGVVLGSKLPELTKRTILHAQASQLPWSLAVRKISDLLLREARPCRSPVTAAVACVLARQAGYQLGGGLPTWVRTPDPRPLSFEARSGQSTVADRNLFSSFCPQAAESAASTWCGFHGRSQVNAF